MARTASHRHLLLRIVVGLLALAALFGMWLWEGTRGVIYGLGLAVGLEVFKWIVLKDDD